MSAAVRVLATGDTQLGVSTVALQDQRDVLDRIVKLALDRHADVVLHGGDVFEGPVITPEHLRAFVDAVAPLGEQGVPLVVLRGNGRHDLATRSVHGLDILREIEGIHVVDRPRVIPFSSGGTWPGVNVCALPWVHPGILLAQWADEIDHDDVSLATAALLQKIAEEMRDEAGSDLPSVLVAHWAISGSSLPAGLPVDEMREPILCWPDLDALGFSAVVGAHIHRPQYADMHGWVPVDGPVTIDDHLGGTLAMVVGSPQPLNFGEEGYEHGVWVIDLDPDGSEAEFVPVESRRFVTLRCQVEEGEISVPEHELLALTRGAVVRVRYEATDEQARRLDHERIRAYLEVAGASRVQIEPTIVRVERARVEEISDQLGPVEALALWCEAEEIGEPLRERMLSTLKDWSEA